MKVDVERIELQQFDRPETRPESGLLRVESAGVGGSEPEVYRKPGHAPVILGHENVGTFEEVGDVAAKRWGVKPGDRVALHEYLPCWHCEWCMQGDFRLCMEVDFFNVKEFPKMTFKSSSVIRLAISTMTWRAGSSPVISRSIQASTL